MAISYGALGLGVASLFTLAGCVSDGPEETTSERVETVTEISVTVPIERLTPFCQAMIDLSERVRSGEDPPGEAVIVEAYRSIRNDVPAEIASDFDAVLAALVAGAPPPTDPPPETIVTAPPSDSSNPPATTIGDTSNDTNNDASGDASSETPPDVGFDAGGSPGERVNNYVTFACRDTQNNPGPPPTQPLDDEATDES